MTLQQLEYVVALDTFKHFVKAAEHCFVTQPTLSMQVKKLEDEIGFLIFERNTTPLTTTSLGNLFVIKARTIIQEVDYLKALVNTERDSCEGEFRIGVIPTVAPYIIPQFLGGFSKKYPNTVLHIEELQTDTVLDYIKKDKLDIGIIVSPLNDNYFREIPLYREPFMFYGNPNHPLLSKKSLKTDDVEGLTDLWLLNKGHCFRNQVLNICNDSTPNKNVFFQSGSIETLKKMVDNYGGFTLVPQLSVTDADKNKIKNFEEPKPIREVSLIVNHSFYKENLLTAIRKEILSVLPTNLDKNERFIKVLWR